jgi:hypothetical protein
MPVRAASSYSEVVFTAPPHLLVGTACALAAAVATLAGPTTIPARRTTTIEVAPDRGAPLERAAPGPAFALAVAEDAHQHWAEAASLYQQALGEWSDLARAHPSPALDRALAKAEHERQRSQLLASERALRPRFDVLAAQVNALEEGRLLRGKLMLARATLGRAPVELVEGARDAFDEALRDSAGPRPTVEAEARLLLCATRAAAGDRAGARLERALVPDVARRDLDNALPLAICAAALGDDDEALARLEMFALRPPPHQLDPFVLREVYLANDWDRLRGQPRFESLFAAALTP